MASLKLFRLLCIAFLGFVAAVSPRLAAAQNVTILNVSYDPTRELYKDINKPFAERWKGQTGQTVTINQSHGGSGKQARGVIDGLQADVVTLGLAYDIDEIAERAGLLPQNWQSRFPDNSSPYTSTIVLLVRKGNAKNIKNWDDLLRSGVSVITPNPKTSGGARWNYLAAWGYALRKNGGNEAAAKDFVSRLYKNVPVLDSGARGATDTFVQRGIGDVLIAVGERGATGREGIWRRQIRNRSSLREHSGRTTGELGGQSGRQAGDAAGGTGVSASFFILSRGRRSQPATTTARVSSQWPPSTRGSFPKLKLFTVNEVFGGWQKAQKAHFADGAMFDQIYQPGQ